MGATVFVQPLDLVKNRMQMSGEKQLNYSLTGTICKMRVFLCFVVIKSTVFSHQIMLNALILNSVVSNEVDSWSECCLSRSLL